MKGHRPCEHATPTCSPGLLMLLTPHNPQLLQPPGLEIASAFVGRLALNVAVTSLTCALQLEDVLVTVRPSSGAPGRQAAPLAPTAHQLDVADAGAAGADGAASGLCGPGIDDGVRLVAAGVETLLQRLSVTVTRLTVRVEGQQAAAAEGGSGAPVATLSCAQISYSAVPSAPEQTAQPQHPGCPATATARRLAFGGLSLAVQQEGLPLLLPLSGEAEVTVTWPLDGLPGSAPHVSAAVSLEAGQLQLRPPDVVALLSLGRSYSAASAQARLLLEQQQQQAGAVAAVGRPAAAPAQQWQAAVEQQLAAAAGHASFLDDLMLPGFPEAAVQDALVESAASVTGQVRAGRAARTLHECAARLLPPQHRCCCRHAATIPQETLALLPCRRSWTSFSTPRACWARCRRPSPPPCRPACMPVQRQAPAPCRAAPPAASTAVQPAREWGRQAAATWAASSRCTTWRPAYARCALGGHMLCGVRWCRGPCCVPCCMSRTARVTTNIRLLHLSVCRRAPHGASAGAAPSPSPPSPSHCCTPRRRAAPASILRRAWWPRRWTCR